ncbi:unnamed protein product [Prunus armeniaca]
MANHFRPLFITANFGSVPIPKIMVDGGAAINLLPHRMLSKMGRTERDLIPTRLTVTNFAGGIIKTHGILDVDVIVGSKKLKISFFVVDTTSTTYNALLGRDWIHQSLCDPSTLHQQLHGDSRGRSTAISAFCHVFRSKEKDRAATIRSITKRLLIYWEERRLFMQNPAINMAEFTHESTEDQEEEELQEEVLDFAPAALDDSLP